MDLRATLNNSFAFLSIGAIFVGLTKVEGDKNLNIWLFIFFFVFLRLKFWLDDAGYFASTDGSTTGFKLGVVSSIISWAFWALAGYSLANIEESYVYLLIMLAISTIWILIAGVTAKFSKEQFVWVVTNVLYAVGLLLLLLHPRFERGLGSYLILGALIVVAALDLIISKSFHHLSEIKDKG